MQKKNLRNKEAYLEVAFVFLCFFIYFTWSLMQPYNTCPDEYMRYDIPKFIFQHSTLPLGQDPSIRNPMWGISYGFGPVLPAIISSIFMKFVSLFTMDEFTLLMGARMVSILASVGTVIVTIKISKHLFSKQVAWTFVALVSLLPQFVFVSTYVNNDALAIFATVLIVYFWVLGQVSHWKIKHCVGLAIAISICALSYFNAYGFILMSIILFFWSSIKFDNEPDKIIKIGKKAALITTIVFLLSGWWFIRNWLIYKDFLGMSTSLQYSQLYAIDQFKPLNRKTPYNVGYSIPYMLFQMEWLKGSYLSFIGKFGYMSISLKEWMYRIYNVIFLCGLAGLLAKLNYTIWKKESNKDKQKIILYVCMFISAIIPFIIALYYSYRSDYQPQGRYWLPMLLPFMFFIGKGIEEVSNLLHRYKGIFIYVVFLAVLVVALASCFQVIPQYYY